MRESMMKNFGDSIGKVGTSLDALASNVSAAMAEQNEIQFIQMLTPGSKKKFVKAKLDLKLAEMREKRRLLGGYETPPKKKKQKQKGTVDLSQEDSSSSSEEEEEAEEVSVDDSPGDNRVKNPVTGALEYRNSEGELMYYNPKPHAV